MEFDSILWIIFVEKYAGTQAVSRAFQVIKLFDDAHSVLSLPDIVELSGLKKTTAFRLLSALEGEGILRKTDAGDYALGAELIALGGRAMRSNRLREVALPHLRELMHQSRESVTIDVLWLDEDNRPNSMVIKEMLGQRVLGLSQYIGSRFQAHATSTGKVLLAYQKPADFARLNLAGLEKYTDQTITSQTKLAQTLARVRELGYASTIDELEVGLTAVSAPIWNHHGEAVAAVCIGGATSRIRVGEVAEILVEKAGMISAEIGHKPA